MARRRHAHSRTYKVASATLGILSWTNVSLTPTQQRRSVTSFIQTASRVEPRYARSMAKLARKRYGGTDYNRYIQLSTGKLAGTRKGKRGKRG